MITRRTNTFEPRVFFTSLDAFIDDRPLFRSRVPYFHYLWLRRDQWVPCSIILEVVGVTMQRELTVSEVMDTLQRLAVELEEFEGFKLERKREEVLPEESNMYHWYYRLTTPDALPKPSSPNETGGWGNELGS